MQIINILKTSNKNALRLSDILPPPLCLIEEKPLSIGLL